MGLSYKRKKRIIIAVVIAIIALPILWLLLEAVYYRYIPYPTHKGIEQYSNNGCAKCEYSDAFVNEVNKLELLSQCEILAYNHTYTNIFKQGVYDDIFVLDLQAEKNFGQIKERIIQLNCENSEQDTTCIIYGDYELYLMNKLENNTCFIVGLSDNSKTVRCLLLRSSSEVLNFSQLCLHFLNRQIQLDWGLR